MFFHFMYWKKIWNIPRFPYWDKVSKHFIVNENGIEVIFESKDFLMKLYFYVVHRITLQLSLLIKNVIKLTQKVKRTLKTLF